MNCSRKIFYESGAADSSGGTSGTDTLEKTDTQITDAPADVSLPIITDEELKEYNFDSREAFKTFLAKHKEESISEEDKKQKENIETANFLKFAAEGKLLTVEENNQYESIKSRADKDLVFDKYLADFKEEHPEIKDPEELKEAATEEFEYEYKLRDSETEATRKKAEARLSREAKELRSPIESKVIEAQNQYKQANSIKETYPKFDKFVDELITKSTPDKLAIVKIKDGDTEIPVEIEITKEDREAMAKIFKKPKAFQTFLESKPEEATQKLNDKMQGWLARNKQAEIAKASFALGKGIGNYNGSNIGATNPFPLLSNNSSMNIPGEETLAQSNERLAKVREQERQRH